ncbi:hypothetical protein [uncultured Duncaniella sp.]|uniref:hypothetical protein n=1 Tax=uncultured Duncaniella sp. TaxID=2768039 RepID=UPI0025A9C8EC|nr:hypothetical protein [uncultured Duncaniella sp.]
MGEEINVILADERLNLRKMERSELKGVYTDAVLSFSFYATSYKGCEFLLLAPKKKDRYTPMQYSNISKRINDSLGKPVAFLFDDLIYYERNRMLSRGVYFIVSDKYAFLPFLIINARTAEMSGKSSLTPVAQYILFYHLQSMSLDGRTYKDIERFVPYKYITISRAMKVLEQFSLCELKRESGGSITVHFLSNGRALWEKAQPYLINPAKEIWYCDDIRSDDKLCVCSYNALAHYTSLNPDHTLMFAFEKEPFKEMKRNNIFSGLNKMDGAVKIEVWEYPPIGLKKVVDKLSLYMTLKNDGDARVENELDIMIDEIW